MFKIKIFINLIFLFNLISCSSIIMKNDEKIILYSKENNIQKLNQFILNKKFNINYKDEFGKTALIYASINNNIEILKTLIKNNANINLRDKNGLYAIDYSCINLNLEITKILLKNNSVYNKKYENISELDLLKDKNYQGLCLKLALNTDNYDDKNLKLLFKEAIYQENINVLKLIINSGYKVKIKNENLEDNILLKNKNNFRLFDFNSSLTNYIINNDKKNLMIFLALNGGVNYQDENKNSALIYSSILENKEIFNLLIKNNINVNIENKEKNTALTYAIKNKNNYFIKLLILKKVNIDKEFINLIHKKDLESINYCIEKSIINKNSKYNNETPLLYLAKKNYLENIDLIILENLIKNKFELSQKDNEGKTALIYSIINKHNILTNLIFENIEAYTSDVEKYLLRYENDLEGKNVLMYAIENKSSYTISKLEEFKLKKEELFLKSVKENNETQVNEILSYNVDIDYYNEDKNTALIIAVENRNYSLIKKILSKNPNKEHRNNYGKTAYDIALELGENLIIDLLKN